MKLQYIMITGAAIIVGFIFGRSYESSSYYRAAEFEFLSSARTQHKWVKRMFKKCENEANSKYKHHNGKWSLHRAGLYQGKNVNPKFSPFGSDYELSLEVVKLKDATKSVDGFNHQLTCKYRSRPFGDTQAEIIDHGVTVEVR